MIEGETYSKHSNSGMKAMRSAALAENTIFVVHRRSMETRIENEVQSEDTNGSVFSKRERVGRRKSCEATVHDGIRTCRRPI